MSFFCLTKNFASIIKLQVNVKVYLRIDLIIPPTFFTCLPAGKEMGGGGGFDSINSIRRKK
ncbi:MAG: hypothetical protein A2W05_07190 [Candidatus Schekmanbacteria bacterium RBG_16_38_10]|uniref:Uncharacterized protein n=1 Tax=Candidatus Schekmanbacteria bacterium RBG_16_38_10 TaxID=1817879 RepID=A0A1F7RT76_9BACT|nr:MAG: hypothetical protein A2W05_07190 [Candidatus Schekmanbacteria bacterium RBG_16_38_10]